MTTTALDRPLDAAISTMFDQRTVFLRGPLEQDNADLLVAQLFALDRQSDEPIDMLVNSPGGIVTGLFAIHDVAQQLSAPVNTRCVGIAASAAAVLLATGTGVRSATENAQVMIHQPLGGVQGTARDIEIQARNIVGLRGRLNEILAERTGKSVEQVAADCDRDHWLSAEAAKDYGLIDEIVPTRR